MARIKGTYFLATVKALKLNRPAAQAELAPALVAYLDKPILSSGWYSEQDHLDLLKALTRCLPGAQTDPWTYLGRLAAERDMKSIYRAQLKPGRPTTSFQRLAQVWSLGHDSGEIEVTIPDVGRGQLDLRGFAVVSQELCRLHGSFFATVPRLAGATGVELDHTLCRARGDDFCRWEVSWKEAGE